jgi:hypothetical protein
VDLGWTTVKQIVEHFSDPDAIFFRHPPNLCPASHFELARLRYHTPEDAAPFVARRCSAPTAQL